MSQARPPLFLLFSPLPLTKASLQSYVLFSYPEQAPCLFSRRYRATISEASVKNHLHILKVDN